MDIQENILIFLNGFAVFIGICNLLLTSILIYKQRDSSIVKLRLFFVFFFGYGLAELVLYYDLRILSDSVVLYLLSVIINILFVPTFGQWVNYLMSFKTGDNKMQKIILYMTCAVCIILWTIDSIFFMDVDATITNPKGDHFCTVWECIVLIAMFCYCGKLLLRCRPGIYATIQTVIMFAFSICVAVCDVFISFYGYNADDFMNGMWLIDDWYYITFFCFATNLNGIVFVLTNFIKQINSLRAREDAEEYMKYTLKEAKTHFEITDRELEVLQLVCQGKNNTQIAQELYISLNTVKKHINSLFRKTESTSRAELISKIRPVS